MSGARMKQLSSLKSAHYLPVAGCLEATLEDSQTNLRRNEETETSRS